MLYDPKWDKHKTADDLTISDFMLWLETKSPDEKYEWSDPNSCLVGQFLTDMTGEQEPDGLAEYSRLFGGWNYLQVAQTKPHTFGAALKRLNALEELAV